MDQGGNFQEEHRLYILSDPRIIVGKRMLEIAVDQWLLVTTELGKPDAWQTRFITREAYEWSRVVDSSWVQTFCVASFTTHKRGPPIGSHLGEG